MKVLHLVPLHIPAGGIVQQAVSEQRAADQAGLDWHVRIFTDIDLPPEAEPLRIRAVGEHEPTEGSRSWVGYAAAKIGHRRALYQWLREHHGDYDLILLRYTTSDLARAGAIRAISTPVVSVHHTLELPELHTNTGYQRLIRVATETIAARRNLRAAAAIVGVTQEIVDYEQQRAGADLFNLTIPNGISLKDVPVAPDLREDVPELLFVASNFVPWHGLDRLIADLAASDAEFVLHLVGDVGEQDARAVAKDPRIRVHGRLTKEAIAPLVARSWVGLSSFALDRKGMKEACTLKVREYLAYGLPTYSGHIDRFPRDALYYRQGPPKIEQILRYAHETRGLTRQSVREACAPLIDKASILSDAYRRLLDVPRR